MNKDKLIPNHALLRNYAKMACRNLFKNKLISFINITGLLIGFTAALLMGLFVLDEISYDRHFQNHDRIYRVTSSHHDAGKNYRSAQTTADVAPVLTHEFPEVEAATRIMPADEGFFFSEEQAFKEKIIFTDSSFLEVFRLNLLIGNEKKCLKNPSSIIISEQKAQKLFGFRWKEKQILGKSLSIDGRIPMSITGVFQGFPDQTHFRTNLLATVPSGMRGWLSPESPVYTYTLLNTGADASTLQSKINMLLQERAHGENQQRTMLELQPLTDIYLFSSLENENARQGNIKNIYALIIASLFLLGITVINFANLHTATSLNRLKETGVRKTMGAYASQLRFQFLSETTFFTFLSLCIAVVLTIALIPVFNDLTGKSMSAAFFLDARVFSFVFALGVCVSLLAGVYPSVYLTKGKTIAALKGLKVPAKGNVTLRGGFITVQFALSCVMIILSIVAYRQIGLINDKALGFDKENTIALSNPYMLGSLDKILTFRNELLALSGVEQISITGYTPSQTRWGNNRTTFPGRDPLSPYVQQAEWLMVDENFIETMGLTLLSGRNFYEDHERDKESVIVNEKALQEFELSGKTGTGSELSVKAGAADTFQTFNVVGVVADFNFGSLHEPIRPVVLRLGYHRFEMALRLSPRYESAQTLKGIEMVWREALPLIPFEYSFIKTRFEQLHESDVTAGNLFALFCMLTIAMSALGLLGTVSFSVVHRTKEIGIRKLLGATVNNIVMLIAQDFVKLVVAGYVLALPFAWILAHRWVADFSYKTEITWWIFVAAGFILIVTTVLTLGYQSVKASVANPVENLRHE